MPRVPASARRFAQAIVALAALTACTGTRPLPAPPEDRYADARLAGFQNSSDFRAWGDVAAPDIEERLALFVEQQIADAERQGIRPREIEINALLLSGGGSDGPYGAGLLVGWSETGERPEFDLVTGISAGAIIAPFAYLGPDYDQVLRELIFDRDNENLISLRIIGGLIDGLGIVDSNRIRARIRRIITADVVRRIAAEHDRGRRLLIGTTNLDAERPVLWRIDTIAKEGLGDPERTADLITSILAASSSIPGAFAPEFFEVTVDGRRYSEMHVDGGVTHQIFFSPSANMFGSILPREFKRITQRSNVYIIRNAKIASDFAPVSPSIVQIASRSLSTVLKFGGRGDIRAIKASAEESGFGLKITSVPSSFTLDEDSPFDPVYLGALFDLGYEAASKPETWQVDIDSVIDENAPADRKR